MAEHRLKPLTPLGHASPESVIIGPVTITEITDTALASLATRACRAGDVATAAAQAGIALAAPGQWTESVPFASFWLAPDHWMIEAPFASHEDIRAALLPLFGTAASITEQTDAWARFDVTASDPPRLFERLCNVDLPRAPAGFATRTVIEHLGCYLVKRTANQISAIGPRSSAAALFHALETAARAAF